MIPTGNIELSYIDHSGSDNRVVDAARCSFGKESSMYSDEQNVKLIKYLITHKHNSPLRHCSMTARITLPLWLHAQLAKYRIGFEINTISRRYVQDNIAFHIPKWRTKPEGGVKQGSGDAIEINSKTKDRVENFYKQALVLYLELIDQGVAIEHARTLLPVSLMTTCFCTGSLEAWAHIYRQRSEEGSQKEWLEITTEIGSIMSRLYPITWRHLVNEEK